MNIRFEIIETNDADHTVVVRYWTDLLPISMFVSQTDEAGNVLRCRTDYNIGLPADLTPPAAGEVPSQEFVDFILKQAPAQWFSVLEAKAQGQVENITGALGVVESFQSQVVREVQARLDIMARKRGYDNIVSLTSYAASKSSRFAAEAQHGVDVRDAAWGKCYEILGEVEAGTRPVPTLEEILAEMPSMEWPA